jgi:predicted DNA-binding transcriptional regulator AlpA
MVLLTKKQAGEMVGFNPEHLMKLVRAGRFPKPIRTGASQNCGVRFVQSEILDWIEQRKAART